MTASLRLFSGPDVSSGGAGFDGICDPRESREALYPLPLVPFESMMLYDDSPAYPMTCGAVLSFAGKLDRPLLEAAVQTAIGNHPLLCSFVRETKPGRWAWVPANVVPRVQWLGEREALDFARCRPFDLRNEIGGRIWVQHIGCQARMFFEFHHACCDGAGGLRFIEDVLACYASGVGADRASITPLPKTDLTLLRGRGRFRPPACSLARRAEALLSDLWHTWNLISQRPAPLASREPITDQPHESWAQSRFITRSFDRDVLHRLRRSATQQGATLNDLLIRDLFLTIDHWNRQCGASHRRVRIAVPVNLRSREDQDMPATNRLSYAFLNGGASYIAKPADLLAKIAAETAWLRRACLPLGLLKKLALLRAVRIGFPMVFSWHHCLATAVFSNLGDPTRRFRARFPRQGGLLKVGNLLLTGFTGATALRPLTRAGLFFNTYADRLTISARFDRAWFSLADATAFLDAYVAQLGAADRIAESALQIAAS
jgi:hypothetical protein